MQIPLAIFLSLSLGAALALAPDYNKTKATDSGEVTNQINKTVTLAPEANVKIQSINGLVSIETWDSDKAEINITVRASDTAAMERRPIIIENTPNSLTIRTEDDKGGRRREEWVRHEVRLKLPKSVNLKLDSINGKVDVGEINGELGVSSVNGGVMVAQAGTATHLNSINGGISVSLLRLGEGGLRVDSINGGVKIGLPPETNAEIDVHSVNGGIDSDLQITVVGEVKRGQLRGHVGGGGPPITISSVNGGVTLRRN
ncbi:MAG TPA: DUF4097 family beta strand repeat-containing protein [Blastocatellia bacterium]|jgi:hypothetical protein|nr:DUF4097 family beta strand repeat-containing protein [Blastocatellia bacterium]